MEKGYDFKVLIEKLKVDGLEIAEESAKKLVENLFSWLEESAKASENKYDDLLMVVFPQAKAYVLEQAEKINKAD